ncbi:MAG: hypothetical protein ACU84Q_16100 [Gammaproteobacteria bacterium]
MNWDAIGAIGEVVGAAGVIATLLYLATQIRQNTIATRNQTTQNLVDAHADANTQISSDPELADILQRGCYDRDSLTDTERLRFNTFYVSAYSHFDHAYHQYLADQLDEKFWRKMEREIPIYVGGLPGVRAWWEQDKSRLTHEFVAYVEKRLETFEAPSTIPSMGGKQGRDE